MSRLMLAMVGCLVLGAGGMWVASNFRVKFEPVGAPDHPPPVAQTTAPAPAEPAKLPAGLLSPTSPKETSELVQAGANLPATLGAATLGVGQLTEEQLKPLREVIALNPLDITELLDGTKDDAISVTGQDLASPILLRNRTVLLNFRFADVPKLGALTEAKYKTLRLTATPAGSETAVPATGLTGATSKSAALDLSGNDFADVRKVTLKAEWVNDDAKNPALPVAFKTQGKQWELLLPTGTAPTIPNVYNGRYSAAQKGTETVQLFTGFARVQVKSKQVGARYEFALLSDQAAKRTVIGVPTVAEQKPLDGGVTEFTLRWEVPNGTPQQLLIREIAPGGNAHQYVSVTVNVTALPSLPKVAVKTLTPIRGATKPALDPSASGTYLLGTNTIDLVVGIAPALAASSEPGGLQKHAQLLLFVNQSPTDFPKPDAQLSAKDVPLTNEATFSAVKFPTDGSHVIHVAFEAGGVLGPLLSVAVNVRQGGFTVSRVSPTDLSNTNDNRIRVTFATAENKANPDTVKRESFSLLLDDGKSDSDQIDSVSPFDSATNSVMLKLKGTVPAGQYRLTVYATDSAKDTTPVRKGVKDVFGNPLNGTYGGDGRDEVISIIQPVGGAQPSVSVGVTPGLPPHVPLAEYLTPRPNVDGVNPSDRVESRVVRLYFQRDAHLVVQTINRDARSYNGNSVDIRRRAADLARNEAEESKTNRQKLELEAERRAQDSRRAEAELKQLEAQLQSARTQDATAASQLTQRQQQLDDARRELARSTSAAEGRVAADGRVQAQRDILTGTTASLAKANTDLNASPGDANLRAQRDALQARQEQELRRLEQLTREVQDVDRRVDPQRQTVRALEAEVETLRQVRANSAAVTTDANTRLATLRATVQNLRVTEQEVRERAFLSDREEGLKRVEQFRREVAAATANPATVVVPKPDSEDPVARCELTVIGEGLIQIRGPVKGLNVIRTMINQIDSPTGQVRVGVHTVQVNGEKVEKMNRVVDNIQKYIDHSRFLTATTGNMLRFAITSVASRKAVEAANTVAPGSTQADRDQKYLYSFYGKDFIDELKSLDSEFLRTGNKVLSLHSMDSTSLAAAVFQMALARNDVREEIIREFQAQLCTALPQAEWQKFVSGLSCPSRLEACFDRQFCTLSQNAKFPGFLGFFQAEVQGADTLTPLQREFVRLAQIFKARMATELELKQRVMERTLLEDRVGNFREEQQKAKRQEDEAKVKLQAVQDSLSAERANTAQALELLSSEIQQIERKFDQLKTGGLAELFDDEIRRIKPKPGSSTDKTLSIKQDNLELAYRLIVDDSGEVSVDLTDPRWEPYFATGIASIKEIFREFVFTGSLRVAEQEVENRLKNWPVNRRFRLADVKQLAADLSEMRRGANRVLAGTKEVTARMAVLLGERQFDLKKVFDEYGRFKSLAAEWLKTDSSLAKRAKDVFQGTDAALKRLSNATASYRAARENARLARRPLDEKKLLDMLVDDMEEKLIDLLDGTRAHTANVDNYLKSVATALDDDFNTQFYQPAFKKIRTLGAASQVYLGQIESTTVLTSNRMLGKVSPTATLELDLPHRDILMREAFKGAKAAVQEYGALLNDPVFLSMVKMYAGAPTGASYGGFGGLPAVKNVLPGLPGSADELIMAQSGGARRPEFGTYMEGLIADPAIYKFETGTGFEIRPVLSPDGQSVAFTFDYMYTTDVREPVRADEKHLGRIKRHLLHTEVQLGNYELREISKYWVSIKAARTSRGVALLQDIPVAGRLFRPAPSAESALQQNLIYSQATIFPTLFDLMGLRYAPTIADLSPEGVIDDEWVARARHEYLRQYIFDYGASRVDDALRILYGERRPDLYRNQRSIPSKHPNGYEGPGLRQRDSHLEEEYDPRASYPATKFAPGMRLPQRFDRDPFDPTDVPGGGSAIPPAPVVPGHPATGYPGSGFPAGVSSSRELPRTPMGTTVTRVPPTGPRTPIALPAIPTNGSRPAAPAPVPTVVPPAAPGVISRSQLPADPTPPVRAYPSDPTPLPRNMYFPR